MWMSSLISVSYTHLTPWALHKEVHISCIAKRVTENGVNSNNLRIQMCIRDSYRAVAQICGIQLDIKWVNDLFYKGKKVCGILTEAVTDFESGNIEFVVVGMGLNLYLDQENLPAEDVYKRQASVYPDRDFGRKQNKYLHELMEKAERRKEELEAENVQTLIYREEPFIYDCDSISFQVYLMIVRKGVWKQKIMVEKI